MEGFEITEEGKKRSKFKALKSFFGKKKKKEPEDVPEGRLLKPSFSSSSINVSSLQPVLEIQSMEYTSKSSMGAKAVSHDSVFCLDPETENSGSKLHSSPQSWRGRSLKGASGPYLDPELSQSSQSSPQQPMGFSTPATSCLDSSAAKYKIALNPRKQKKKKRSTSVKVKQEDQDHSLEFKEKTTTKTKQADQKEQQRDSTGLSSQEQKTRGQALSTDAALSPGYLTSESYPRRRRRRDKNESGIIERSVPKSTQVCGLSSRGKSSPSEVLAGREHSFLQLYLEKQSTEQPSTSEAEVSRPQEMLSDKEDVKREMTDIDVEASKAPAPQPTPTYMVESMAGSPPSRRKDRSSGSKKKKDRAALLPWIRKSTSQEEATVSMKGEAQVHTNPFQVGGEEVEALRPGLQRFQPKHHSTLKSSTYYKERHSKRGLRAFSGSVSSATVKDDGSVQIVSLPLRRWPNAKEISSESKSSSEYESSSEMQLGPTHSLKHKDEEEEEEEEEKKKKEKKKKKEEDEDDEDDEDDDVFLKSENVGAGLSMTKKQKFHGYSSQPVRKARAREVSSEPRSSSEDERSSEEVTSVYSSQSLEEFEECSESRGFISGEQLAPRSQSHGLEEAEEKGVSTESSSYVEKYHSSEDLSSSEEEQLLERPKQAWGQFRDKQEVPPVSKRAPKERSVSAKPVRTIYTSPPMVSSIRQQQPPVLVNISLRQSRSMEPLSPRHTVKAWLCSQPEHQEFTDLEDMPADWDILTQPGCPSQSPARPVLEKEAFAGPELAVFQESIAAQPRRYPSQAPPVSPNTKKELSLGEESVAVEGRASMEPLPPWRRRHRSQPLLKPFIQQQVSAFEREVSVDPRPATHPLQPWMKPQGKQSFSSTPESTALEGNTSMEHAPPTPSQPRLQPYQNVPLEFEALPANIISMGPVHSRYPAQPLTSPQSQPVSESTSVKGDVLMELLPSQPSAMPKFQPPMTQDSVRAPTQWSSPMEARSAQPTFQSQANPKPKQVPSGPDKLEGQGSISIQPGPPRWSSQLWLSPTFEQISVPQGSVSAKWVDPIYSAAPRMPSQLLMGSIIPVDPLSPRHPSQARLTTPFEQGSAPPDSAAAWDIPIPPAIPGKPSQPLMASAVKQPPVFTDLGSVSVPQSSSVELMPSGFPCQPRADPESCAVGEAVSIVMRPRRPHSQPPMSSEFKEGVSSAPVRASGEWSVGPEPVPSKYTPQLALGPELEQQASSLEGVAKEGDASREAWLSGHPSQTIVKHKVQKIPSSFQSPFTEGGTPWKPLPPRCPTSSSVRSKVLEISSRLESAVAEESSQRPQNSRAAPSQSFVRFMAQQVFSESTDSETKTYTKPRPRNRGRPSRAQLRPKLEEHSSSYSWNEEPKEDTTLKNLPMKQPSQSPRRPEGPQEVLPYFEGAPLKWSSFAGDASQSPGKLEYWQKASVPLRFPEEGKKSEGHLPSTQPSQAFNVSGLQSPILSTEWGRPEGHPPPSRPRAFLSADYEQEVYLRSANIAAEGTVSEKTLGSRPMSKGPASSATPMKYSQGYGDVTKSTPISATKPASPTTVPAQKALVALGTYFKEEFPQSPDGNESLSVLSSSRAGVENVFGVRLRSISQKSGIENPYPSASFDPVSSSVSKDWMSKGALQDPSGGPKKSSPALSVVEKQGNRTRYEGTFKKAAVYRPPEKTSSWEAGYSTEPAWIAVAKQRQKGFASHLSRRARSKDEIMAETKESRYEEKNDSESEVPPKEPEPITDIPEKMSFASIIHRHEMIQSRLSKKSVAFEKKMFLPYMKEKETRRSSSLPPRFPSQKEPVWFLMAKKKAQAWSQMAETMQ
ncbi:LOW QUALITY PROTEIN: acrosomal protein KIAA1210 homolog [Acomys russatus]|uniref:LOW QUALITY PROTEIN: acrosomal protein KIAA1210 homolog n=1 Tax=Acomys russatus TaxID=60746 RepID=UPI0021E1D516|nr:LOW QUALITY PROTEIN: acrosomal protein KIAA1210 homolog [Acomys russatus]